MTRKRVRLQLVFVAVAMLFSIISISYTNFNVNADTTDTVPTLIRTEAELKGITGAGYYKLSNDIALTSNWTPIANFTGRLDGNGHVISNLKIVSTPEATIANAAFFASSTGAVIKNLGIKAADISGTHSAIFVANSATTTLQNCYGILNSGATISGNVPGQELLGNIANTALTNCYYNTGNITALNTNKNDEYVKWVGSTDTPTLKIFNKLTGTGTLGSPYIIYTESDLANLADLVNEGVTGYSAAYYKLNNNITASTAITPIGDFSNPFNGKFNGSGFIISGKITGGSYSGLFGNIASEAEIKMLGVNIDVTGTDNVGGLIGNANGGTVDQCYSSGSVKSTNTVDGNAGGLVGTAISTKISDCYATSNVTGGKSLGGLAGNSSGAKFTNCYTTSANFSGGTTASCTNCYSVGSSTSVSGLTIKTLAQMSDGTLVFLLNGTNNSSPLFGEKINYYPVLTNVGEGKGIGVPCKVTITQTQTDSGTIKILNGSTEVKSGDYVDKNTTLTIQSTPKTGFELTSLKVGGTSLLTTSFSVTSDVTIEPTFSKIETYAIKVSKNDGGTVTPSDANVLVKKGTSQTFTITANTGYKIESVTFSGGGLTVSGDTYTTAVLTKDESLTVKFLSKTDGVKEVTSTSEGIVVTVKSIEYVIDQIPSNIGNIIKVPMDKNTVIDDKTLAELKGKNITVILDMGTYSWRINGQDITGSNLSSINLGVTVGSGVKAIDEKYMNKFSKFADKTQVDLVYSGAFPFNATLTIKAPGTNNVGRYANLFYFNESTNAFEVADSCKIASDGTATFKFKHASKYVVAVADKALALQDLSAGASIIDISNPLVKMDTTQLAFATALLLLVIAGGVTLLFIVRKNN